MVGDVEWGENGERLSRERCANVCHVAGASSDENQVSNVMIQSWMAKIKCAIRTITITKKIIKKKIQKEEIRDKAKTIRRDERCESRIMLASFWSLTCSGKVRYDSRQMLFLKAVVGQQLEYHVNTLPQCNLFVDPVTQSGPTVDSWILQRVHLALIFIFTCWYINWAIFHVSITLICCLIYSCSSNCIFLEVCALKSTLPPYSTISY